MPPTTFLKTIAGSELDGGRYVMTLGDVGLTIGPVFKVYDASGNCVDVPTKCTPSYMEFDFSAVAGASPSWTAVFTGAYRECDGYDEVLEVMDDVSLAGGAVVCCKAAGLEVVLPPVELAARVKVVSSAAGGVRVSTPDGSYVGGSLSMMMPSDATVVLESDGSGWDVRYDSTVLPEEEPEEEHYDDSSSIVHRTNVETREQFKDWIYRKLGWPLLSVELTDDMLDDCINDAILAFSEYAYQDRRFFAFELKDYVEGVGLEMPIGMTIVTRLVSNAVGPNAVGAGKIDNYMNDLIANGAIGFPMLGRPAGAGWTNYELAMSYLDLSQKMLGGDYDFSYDPRSRILTLYPDPVKAKQEKGWIVVEAQCVRSDDKQFGDNWVKAMALAKAKIVLGTVRGKFSDVSLPGGGKINDSDKDEGRTDEERLMTELHERFPICNVFMA